jgi:tetratricopeptide (TPR) repeat protein
MILRLAAAALAVVAASFLGARLHDHDVCQGAREELFVLAAAREGDPEPAVRRVRESCRGTTALAAAATAVERTGRPREALALAREATDREPENAATWRALAEVAEGLSPGDAREARERLAELDPLGAKP